MRELTTFIRCVTMASLFLEIVMADYVVIIFILLVVAVDGWVLYESGILAKKFKRG